MSQDNLYYCHEYNDEPPFTAAEVREFLRLEGAGWAELVLDDGWVRFLAGCPLPGAPRDQFLLAQAAGWELKEIRAMGGGLYGAWEE